MAILDRPMFQRRLTKEQLSVYGIPAFANGGVVQKFNKGSDENGVERPDYSENFTKPINVQQKFDEATTEMLDPKAKEDAIKLGQFFSSVSKLQDQIALLEKTIVYKEANGMDVSADKAELANLKSQLVEEQKEVEALKNNTSPAPEVIEDDIEKEETQVKDTEEVEDDIDKEKSELDRLKTLALERSALYKQMLGDPKEMMKQQGLLQLAQFGLNLASARGGNLAEKIAKSAQDPLTAFAQLASDASKDARAIDLAAIKSAEDQLQTEIEIAGKTDELEKVLLYTKAKETQLNPLGAATTTSILPKSEITEIDVYRDETGINKKLFNKGGGAGQVFQGEDGKLYKVKPGALEKKGKYLYFEYPDDSSKSDFTEIQGVEVLDR